MSISETGSLGISQGQDIQLFTDAETEAADACIAIRWCIGQELLQELAENHALNPHVLLVVTKDRFEVCRKIVPLRQEMEYFYFQSSGEHRIQATVLCYKNKFALKRWILEKTRAHYHKLCVLDYNGDLRERIDEDGDVLSAGRGEVCVNVAPEFFAKKPPKWLWWWVNLWYETEPRDQCQFRRRCMLAFSVQLPVVPLFVVFVCLFRFLIAATFKFGIGMRNIDFAPAFHPFNMETRYIWPRYERERSSVFLRNKWGKQRPWFVALLMPVIALSASWLLFCLWAVAVEVFDLEMNILPVLLFGYGGGILLLIMLECVCSNISKLAFMIPSLGRDRRKDGWWEKRRLKEKRRQEAFERRFEATYAPLVCQGKPLEASLQALPRHRRTIYLQFMDLKTRVCKPFPKIFAN